MFNVKSECLLDVCVNLVDRDFAAWFAKASVYLGGEKKEIGDPRQALVASEILDFKIAKATSEDDEKKILNDNNSDDNTHES